jgi:integrative and conjugative element protein (TIGR02256 family)
MNLRVEISTEAEETIRALAAESVDGRETGGILLGRGPGRHGTVRVEQAGDPGPNAQRRPDFFLRDLEHAQQLAAAAWEARRAVWVGEWHTHPAGDPRPSQRDMRTYAGLLSAAELAFEVVVSIIVMPDAELGWERPALATWIFTADPTTPLPRTDPEVPSPHGR